MQMSVSNYDLLQAKVDAELARYTEELMSHGPQEVVDNAYELVIKSELAVRLESSFLTKQQIRALLDQENPLAYINNEADIVKFVNALISNSKGEGKEGDPFWTNAETL